MGLIVALLIQLWIGVGAAIVKPVYPRPSLSIDNCPIDNITESLLTGNHTLGENFTDVAYTMVENVTFTTTAVLPEVVTKDR